ncbi:MAG: prolipoprotein diacylglyceryl transferase [Thermodesulfobacteriota bacterium]
MPYRVFGPFHIGPFMVNFYGIMFAVGVYISYYLAVREARVKNLDRKVVENLFFYLLMGGIIGARIGYIVLYWPEDLTFDLLEAFKIWKGGLAFYGGFIGALITGLFFLRRYRMDFWRYADAFTIPLVVGHLSGRMGDYLIGGHPGKLTNLPWAILLNGELRHPVVLYEMTGLVMILFIILILRKRGCPPGFLFTSYVALYSVQRIFLDIFRIELTDPRYLGLTPSQFIAIGLLLSSILFMFPRLIKVRS